MPSVSMVRGVVRLEASITSIRQGTQLLKGQERSEGGWAELLVALVSECDALDFLWTHTRNQVDWERVRREARALLGKPLSECPDLPDQVRVRSIHPRVHYIYGEGWTQPEGREGEGGGGGRRLP